MRLLVATALAVTALLSPATTGAAVAYPVPTGTLCGLQAAGTDGAMTGVLHGGPVTFRDSSTSALYAGYLVCTVQVNASTHAGADAASGAGATGQTSVLPPYVVGYHVNEGDNVFVCAHVVIPGQSTLYWADSNDPLVEGNWSTDQNAPCGLVISAEALHDNDPLMDLLDSVLCPIFAIFFPPDGDVGIFWECPPHDDDQVYEGVTTHSFDPPSTS